MYSIKYGTSWLHNPTSEKAILSSASLTFGENSFSYCDFEIQSSHPLYNTIIEKDYTHPVRIYEDDTLLFSGYIDSISKDFDLVKSCKCVTELAYLQDTIVRPYSTLKNSLGTNVKSTFEDYFAWLISQHNSQVEPNKQFKMGINEGNFFDYYDNFYTTSLDYPSTWDEIEEKVIDNAGAYIRIRYEGTIRCIDLLYQWLDANKQAIELGKNLLDLTIEYNSEDLATCVIPTGASLSETSYYYDNGYFVTSDTKAKPQEDTVLGYAEIKQYYYKAGTIYMPVVTSANLTLQFFEKVDMGTYANYNIVEDTDSTPGSNKVYGVRKKLPSGGSEFHICDNLSSFKFFEKQAKYTEIDDKTETHYGRTLYYRKIVRVNGNANYIYTNITIDKDTPIEFYRQDVNNSSGSYTKVDKGSTLDKTKYNYFLLTGYEEKDGKKDTTKPKYTKLEKVASLRLYKLEEDYIETKDYFVKPLSKKYFYQSGDINTYSEISTNVDEPLTIYIKVADEEVADAYIPIKDKNLDKGNIYAVKYKDPTGIISFPTLDGISSLNIYEYDELKNKGELPLTIEGEREILEQSGYIIEKDMIVCTSAANKYGTIIRKLDFSDITNKNDLYKYGVKALRKMISPKETLQVKAIDMHFINPSYKSIRVGEYVQCTSKMHDIDQYLLCSAIDMDLVDPRYTTYTLGTTYDTLTGESNQRMKDLNSTINTTYKSVAAISTDAKQQAYTANNNAIQASTVAVEARSSAYQAKEIADKAMSASSVIKNEVDEYKNIMGNIDTNLEYSYNLRFEKDPYYAPYVYKIQNDSEEETVVSTEPKLYSNEFKILPIGGNGVLYSSCCEITEIMTPTGVNMTVQHISNEHLEIHDEEFNTIYSSEETYFNDKVIMTLQDIDYTTPYSEPFTVKGICHFVDCSAGYENVDKWSVIHIPFVVESKVDYDIIENELDIEFIEVSNESSDDPTKDYTDIDKSVDTTGNIREIMDQVETIIRNEIAKYLPLIGGQLTGDLTVNSDVNVSGNISSNTSNIKRANVGSLYIGDHISYVGAMKSSRSSVTSLPSGSYTAIASIELGAGTWILSGNTRFEVPEGKRVCANIFDKAGTGVPVISIGAAPSATSVTVTRMVRIDKDTTYYFNVYHNSGSTITKRADFNSAMQDGLTAVRIA